MRPALLLLACLALGAADLPAPGQWDGVTESAPLDGPYADPRQAPPPFGIIGYFSQPWRGYLDTWPRQRWLDFPGTAFGDDRYAEPLAALMEECGVRFARIEVPWGALDWDDDLSASQRASLTTRLTALKRHGIRPLLLLNAHHGGPCPLREVEVELTAPAAKGGRELRLKPGTTLRVGYVGPKHATEYKAAYPLITALGSDGVATLSAPLTGELPAGTARLQELKYQPFQGPKRADGSEVPASAETIDGWKRYVLAVTRFARGILGSTDDAGFDVEVWNELTFGADFLDIANYCDPKPAPGEPIRYARTRAWTPALRPDARLAFEAKGFTALVPITTDLVADPANGLPGVAVISGFTNQWPWNGGSDRWIGQAGISRHYYTGADVRRVGPDAPLAEAKHATMDALGAFDGRHAGGDWLDIVPGTAFVPRFTLACPEFMLSGWKTETAVRDLAPDSRRTNTPEWMGRKGRYTTNGELVRCRYWQTEVNWDRRPFIAATAAAAGAAADDPRVQALSVWTSAKHQLRQYLFQCAKGFDRIFLFAAQYGDDASLALLPNAFFRVLDANGGRLDDAARAQVPPGWWGVRWFTQLMRSGADLAEARPLTVDALVEHHPRLVFAGDGTPTHPHRWNRDFFACLPFQVDAKRFAIAYYVATPDATFAWDAVKDPLDPARYDLPDQAFDLTLGNLRGAGATAVVHDLLHDRDLPCTVLARTATSLTVRVPTTDCPRVLVVEEAAPGPTVIAPRAVASAPDAVTVTWRTDVPNARGAITWGRDWPARSANRVEAHADRDGAWSVTIPAGDADLVAVRIEVESDGLRLAWPRWDEDVVGQVVLPQARPRAPDPAPSVARPVVVGEPRAFAAPADVALARAQRVGPLVARLPADAAIAGGGDDVTATLGSGDDAIAIRLRALPSGATDAEAQLPTTSAVDHVERTAVRLPSGVVGELIDLDLAAVARPGATDLRQRHLLVPVGDGARDLVVVSAAGPPATMTRAADRVAAVLASLAPAP